MAPESSGTPPLPPPDVVWGHTVAGLTGDPATSINTAVEMCARHASDHSRVCVSVVDSTGSAERWTYHDLECAAARFSDVFHRSGLRPGDRVAAILSRQIETWICALAVWRSGLTYVPLFCGFGADALSYRLEASGARMVVVDQQWRDTLSEVQPTLTRDLQIVTVAGAHGAGLRPGDSSFWPELDRGDAASDPVATRPHDPATLLFTSGTTGPPKACVIPHSGFVSLIPYAVHALGLTRDDLLFATSDPGWAYGLYTTGLVPLTLGIPLVMYSGQFDPAAWLGVMRSERPTYLTAAPTAIRSLLQSIEHEGAPAALRAAATAGEPLDADTVTAWQRLTSSPIRDGYGLTEIGMVLANLADASGDLVPGAMGDVVPGFEALLVERDGTPVGALDEGLIAVKRPRFQLSIGYDNVPATWDARWVGDLFVTEDRARRDEEGRWWFVGRDDDMIVTSGYKIGPIEIETALLEHPAVAEAAVVADPDPERGSIIRAVIVTRPDAPAEQLLTPQLQDAVRTKVGRHAYPRIIDYVEALPRTEVGKIRRAELRRGPGS